MKDKIKKIIFDDAAFDGLGLNLDVHNLANELTQLFNEQLEAEREEHHQDLVSHERDIDNNYVHKSKLKAVREVYDKWKDYIEVDCGGREFVTDIEGDMWNAIKTCVEGK